MKDIVETVLEDGTKLVMSREEYIQWERTNFTIIKFRGEQERIY